MMCKKVCLSILFLFSVSLHAMDSDVFGAYTVGILNELHAQERQEKQKKLQKHIKQKETINSDLLGYSSPEIKLLSFGLAVTFAAMILDYMKR